MRQRTPLRQKPLLPSKPKTLCLHRRRRLSPPRRMRVLRATTAPAGTEAASEAVSEETAKAPETVEEIVEFYKKAAEATDKTDPKTMTKMELTSLDGGKGAVGALVSALEGPGRKALERNSSEGDDVPGGFERMTASTPRFTSP